ncbi:unnamed protein product [Sphagnum balticum]
MVLDLEKSSTRLRSAYLGSSILTWSQQELEEQVNRRLLKFYNCSSLADLKNAAQDYIESKVFTWNRDGHHKNTPEDKECMPKEYRPVKCTICLHTVKQDTYRSKHVPLCWKNTSNRGVMRSMKEYPEPTDDQAAIDVM